MSEKEPCFTASELKAASERIIGDMFGERPAYSSSLHAQADRSILQEAEARLQQACDLIDDSGPREAFDAVVAAIVFQDVPALLNQLDALQQRLSRLHALIEQWRNEAAIKDSFHATMGIGWRSCANDLERLLLEGVERGETETDQ